MKRNIILLNLGLALVLALSFAGCEGGRNPGRADTSDVELANSQQLNAQSALFELAAVASRGGPNLDATGVTNCPMGSTCSVPRDAAGNIQLFRFDGIGDQPQPNLNFTNQGTRNLLSATGAPGPHIALFDPTGNYVFYANRARFPSNTTAANHVVGTFQLDITAADVQFPPTFSLGAPQIDVSERVLASRLGAAGIVDSGDISAVFSPDARHLYLSDIVFDNNGNAIPQLVVFSFNGINGELTALQALTPGVLFSDLDITSDGRFLYGVDRANSQIITYARDSATGSLTQLNTTAGPGDARQACLDRFNNFYYVVGLNSGQIAGFSVGADGTLTAISVDGTSPAGPVALDGTGAGATGVPVGGIAANPRSDLICATFYSGSVVAFRQDTTTGVLSQSGLEGGINGARNSGFCVIEPTGRFLLVTSQADGTQAAGNATVQGPNGEIAIVNPQTGFTGSVAAYRINADGSLLARQSSAVTNPWMISFAQRIIPRPVDSQGGTGAQLGTGTAGTGTTTTTTTTTGGGGATLTAIQIQAPDGNIVAVGDTLDLDALGTFSDGSTSDITSSVDWSVSDTSIASISQVTGNVTGLSPGNVTVTATRSGITSTTQVTVTP